MFRLVLDRLAGGVIFLSLLAGCGGAAPTAVQTPAPTSPAPSPTPTLVSEPTPTTQPTPILSATSTPRHTGLAEFADRLGLLFGVAMETYQCDAYPECRDVLLANFNSVTIEYGIQWPDDVEKDRGHFDFSYADSQVAFAKEHGLVARGHSLLFGTNLWATSGGGWLRRLGMSRGEMALTLDRHVSDMVLHYAGSMDQWVVVNEPYLEPYRTDDIFYLSLGYDYIDSAFDAAREADPSALLIYNDSDNHTPTGMTTALTLETLARLRAKGLVDAVGLQMHIDGSDPPRKADVIAAMRAYGIPVYVTEFSVHLANVRGDLNERLALQARVSADMLEACLESGVCKGFTIWSFADNSRFNGTWEDDLPAIFDGQYHPKPAYFAIWDVLSDWASAVEALP